MYFVQTALAIPIKGVFNPKIVVGSCGFAIELAGKPKRISLEIESGRCS